MILLEMSHLLCMYDGVVVAVCFYNGGYYLAPGGGCEVLFSPGLSVCVSVCVCLCVSGQYFCILFSRLLERYRSEIHTGYLYGCTQFTKIKLTFTGQGLGSVPFCKYSHITKLSHRKIFNFFFIYTSLDTLFDERIKNLSEQRNDVTKKYVNIWTLTCKTPIPK